MNRDPQMFLRRVKEEFGIELETEEEKINKLKKLCKEKGLDEDIGVFLYNLSLPGGGYELDSSIIMKFLNNCNKTTHLLFAFNNGKEIEDFIKNELKKIMANWNNAICIIIRPSRGLYLKDEIFGTLGAYVERIVKPFTKMTKKLKVNAIIESHCRTTYMNTRFENETDEKKYHLHLLLGEKA